MKVNIQQIIFLAGLCLLADPECIISESSQIPTSGQLKIEQANKLESYSGVWDLLEIPSFVPQQEESFIHIAGGFFSRFNRRYGAIKQCRQLLPPSVGVTLANGLEYLVHADKERAQLGVELFSRSVFDQP